MVISAAGVASGRRQGGAARELGPLRRACPARTISSLSLCRAHERLEDAQTGFGGSVVLQRGRVADARRAIASRSRERLHSALISAHVRARRLGGTTSGFVTMRSAPDDAEMSFG